MGTNKEFCMTPEAKARQFIDQKLEQAGWVIQDMKQLNLGAGLGIAVREYPTDTGPADYVLFVNRQAIGVIEAKKRQRRRKPDGHGRTNSALRHGKPQMAHRQHTAALFV